MKEEKRHWYYSASISDRLPTQTQSAETRLWCHGDQTLVIISQSEASIGGRDQSEVRRGRVTRQRWFWISARSGAQECSALWDRMREEREENANDDFEIVKLTLKSSQLNRNLGFIWRNSMRRIISSLLIQNQPIFLKPCLKKITVPFPNSFIIISDNIETHSDKP